METERKCPLFKADCKREGCAWWVQVAGREEIGRCAVVTIGQNINVLNNSLGLGLENIGSRLKK